MSTLRVTEIQSNTTTFYSPVRFETSGGSENGRLVKGWVNFNGQGTVAIRDDFNINSITDKYVGGYRVNFSNSFSNSNYGVQHSSSVNQGSVITVATSYCEVETRGTGGGTTDAARVYVNLYN